MKTTLIIIGIIFVVISILMNKLGKSNLKQWDETISRYAQQGIFADPRRGYEPAILKIFGLIGIVIGLILLIVGFLI